MSEERVNEARGLDRRGFLAAAAGAAATGAAAATLGPWASKSSGAAAVKDADGNVCLEHNEAIPKLRRGVQTFTLPAVAWSTETDFLNHVAFMNGLDLKAWEFAGSYPTVNGINLGTNPLGWATFGSYAKSLGFRIVGTHDGPSPTTAAALGSAITKMNGWNCSQLGAGSGWPSVPGAGTAITTPNTISAWQASCATMNSWGKAYQTGDGSVVLGGTPYTGSQFNGQSVAGRPCARYYRHFHSEQGKYITGTGTKFDGNYIAAVAYTELDPQYAYAQSDQCWALDGFWMSGGGPSVGLQGPGDPNPGQGNNRLMMPDYVERWQDRIFTFHIKDLGPTDQSTQVANIGDNNGTAGAVPWNTNQDTVPYPEILPRLRHPERHEYLLERDSQSASPTANNYYKKIYQQCSDMFNQITLDRTLVHKAFVIPTTDAEWAAIKVTAIGQRPPTTAGAPGPACDPKINGASETGDVVEVVDNGVWSRFSENARNYNYIWLRDGSPLSGPAPLFLDEDGPCSAHDDPTYTLTAADVGHVISCQVTARNQKSSQDSASSAYTDAVTVTKKPLLGTRKKGPGSSTLSAGLPEAYQATTTDKGTINSLDVFVDDGTTANWLVAGIYSNYHNHPDLLLATGEARLDNQRSGSWVTVKLGNVNLAANTKYWIAVLGLGGVINVSNYDGANGFTPSETYKRTKGDAAELPTAWKTGTVYPHDGPLTAAAG